MRNVEININKIQQQYDAGIRYEHKASKLTVTLPDDFPKEADYYLLNFESNIGNRKTSNKLTPVDGKVTYIVPELLTKSNYQYVALSAYKSNEENDIEIYRSPKFKLKFGDTVVSSDIASENAQDAFQEVINLIKIGKLKGDSGKSAYELACEAGYRGTVAEWLLSLIGKSAYEVAVENGFKGTQTEWLDELKAVKRISGNTIAADNLSDGFYITSQKSKITFKGNTWKVNSDVEYLAAKTIFHINNNFKDVEGIGTILTALGGSEQATPFLVILCGTMETRSVMCLEDVSNESPQRGLRNPISSGAVYTAISKAQKDVKDFFKGGDYIKVENGTIRLDIVVADSNTLYGTEVNADE